MNICANSLQTTFRRGSSSETDVSFSCKMDWTNEAILRFLRLYKSHQCLWDTKQSKQHRNRDRVNEAWLDIQKNMNNMNIPCTIQQLKKKKESLMSAYRAYKTKIKNSTSVVGGTVYKPSWFAFTTMDSFLSTVYLCNATSNWRNYQSENEQSTENADAQFDEANSTEDEVIPRKRTKRQSIDIYQPHEDYSETHEVDLSHETSQQVDDECEILTKLWARKLKKLPEDRRENLIYQINNLLYKECIDYHGKIKKSVVPAPVQILKEEMSDCYSEGSQNESKLDEESNGFMITITKTEPEDDDS